MELLTVSTPLGRFLIGQEGEAVVSLTLPGRPAPAGREGETPLLLQARDQLLAYLAGERRAFSLPLDPRGTPFQRQVWAQLEAIPYGETRTYSQLALALGRPKAVRAVGQANHRNPIPIFIPCHRVVGKDGSLTGYAGGLPLKERLLTLESAAPPGPPHPTAEANTTARLP